MHLVRAAFIVVTAYIQPLPADAQLAAEFLSIDSQTAFLSQPAEHITASSSRALPDDALARSAADVLAAVAHEPSGKFAASAFIGLMRQLRDGDVALDGDRLVPRDQVSSGADIKGKGRERADGGAGLGHALGQQEMPHARGMNGYIAATTAAGAVHAAQIALSAEEQRMQADVDPNDAYFAQENADYMRFWANADAQRAGPSRTAATTAALPASASATQADWGHLQADWDRFEATADGIRALEPYPFTPNNPYVGSAMTHQHMLHTGADSLHDVSPFPRPASRERRR
jgi:peroxin-5